MVCCYRYELHETTPINSASDDELRYPAGMVQSVTRLFRPDSPEPTHFSSFIAKLCVVQLGNHRKYSHSFRLLSNLVVLHHIYMVTWCLMILSHTYSCLYHRRVIGIDIRVGWDHQLPVVGNIDPGPVGARSDASNHCDSIPASKCDRAIFQSK